MPTTDRQHPRTQARPLQREDVGDAKGHARKGEIRWEQWWPFTQATGAALKQLNKRQPKQQPEQEEALL